MIPNELQSFTSRPANLAQAFGGQHWAARYGWAAGFTPDGSGKVLNMVTDLYPNMPYQVAAKLSRLEYEKIQDLVKAGVFINASDLVREAIREKLAEFEFNVKAASPTKVRKELRRYAKERGGIIWPDEAARELGYSLLQILEALQWLKREGKAEELKSVEAKVQYG